MYEFNIYSLSSILFSEIYFLIGAYILSKNTKHKAGWLFFLFSSSFALWGLGEGMRRASINPRIAYFWADYVATIFATIQPVLFMHFWLEFSGETKKFKTKLPVILIYLPMIPFLFIELFYPRILITDLVKEHWGFSSQGGGLYQLYMAIVALYVAITAAMAFRKAFTGHERFRKVALYIGAGIILPLIMGVITQVLRPILHLKVPELSVVSSIVLILSTAYAINKYGILTINNKMVAENIITTMNDYMVTVNKDMKIIFTSESFLKDTGYQKNEIKDEQIKNIISVDIISLKHEKLLEKLPIENKKAEIITKENKKIPVLLNISNLQEGENESLGLILTMRDMRKINRLIKDLSEKQKELERKNSDLEKFNQVAGNRDERIIELEKKLEEVKNKTI